MITVITGLLDLDVANSLHCNVQFCRYLKYLNDKFGQIQVNLTDYLNRVVISAFIVHAVHSTQWLTFQSKKKETQRKSSSTQDL